LQRTDEDLGKCFGLPYGEINFSYVVWTVQPARGFGFVESLMMQLQEVSLNGHARLKAVNRVMVSS